MEKDQLTKAITDAVKDYIADEECYDDNAQIEIDPTSGSVSIFDSENEIDDRDYYSVMDLVRMSSVNPGQWEVDPEAVADVVAQYTIG